MDVVEEEGKLFTKKNNTPSVRQKYGTITILGVRKDYNTFLSRQWSQFPLLYFIATFMFTLVSAITMSLSKTTAPPIVILAFIVVVLFK